MMLILHVFTCVLCRERELSVSLSALIIIIINQ